MENANSKMMGRIAEIENCVLSGFVLDDRGNWVSIADKKALEDDFLAHLEAGRVLHSGQWVQFADVKKSSPAPLRPQPANAAPETKETAFYPKAAPVPPATVTLKANQQGVVAVPDHAGEEETSVGLFAPETKVIELSPPLHERESALEDPESGYAMETGLFMVDHSNNVSVPPPAQPGPAERETKRALVFVPRSIPTWEKEESRDKKRGYIIGGVIIGIIGIAAIVVIVLQVL